MSKEKKSIFQGVLDAVRGQRILIDPQTQQAQFSGGAFIPRPAKSAEDLEQQYLDWQVMKVASDIYARTLYFNADRVTSYADFDAMDQSPAISAALDIMRDECLTKDEYGQVLQIHSDNERIKESLEDLFHNRLGINYSLRIIIRDMLKYGDYFLYLITNKDEGILNVQALPAREVHREEGIDERDPTACRFRWDGNNLYFEEWQIAHFRLMENSNKMPYGRSILESARKTWKQLQLAMDAMLTYRITRAPDRRVFYVEVGTLDEADIKTYIQNIQRQVKKQPIVNQQNGQVNYRYDPMNITEDYFIPVKGDHHSKIDTLPGASNMSDIEDIEFLEKQLFSAIKVPKPYLNYSENVPGGTSLSQSDIRFAKTINGFQEAAILELKKMAKVHLFFLGYGASDVNNFELTLNNPSTQLELMKLEIMKARLEVGKEWHDMNANSFASWTWVMENIHGFSKAQIKMMLRQKKIEKKLFAEIDSAAETYKKTGIFKDLDRRYEIDGGVDQVGGTKTADGEEGGGFSASSALGNMDMGGEQMGGGDSASMDAGPDMGAAPAAASGASDEAPSLTGGDETAPLSESRKKGNKKKTYEDLVDELMETVEEKSKVLIGDGVLAKGDKLSDKVDSMIRRMSEKMGPISVLTESDMINSDEVEVDMDNPLFETYNQMSRKLLNMMNDVDTTLFDGQNDEVIDIEDNGDE